MSEMQNVNMEQQSIYEKKRKKKKLRKQQKSSSHQSRKRGHLGREAPSPEKKKAVSEDQEGCCIYNFLSHMKNEKKVKTTSAVKHSLVT